MSLRVLRLAAAGLLLLGSAIGQKGGTTTPPPPSSGGTPPPGGGPGRGPGPSPTPNQNTIGNQPNPNTNAGPSRPIFITGQVIMDDGSELPRNVEIERLCGTTPRVEGHTDSKGYFSIELGARNVDALQDASTGGLGGFDRQSPDPNFGASNRQLLIGCELRARAAGYQSQVVDLSTRQSFDNPDIGTILLHRMVETEGTTISATTLAAPKDAKKAFQKGLSLVKKKKLDDAQASFQHAVDLYPKYAEGWYELGRLQAAGGQLEPARKSFDAALSADSRYLPPYVQLSMLELQAKHWQQLADITDKAVRLDPFTYPQEFFFNAVANYNLQHVDIAEQSARRAQKLDTRHQIPQISHLLGVILAGKSDYSGAASQMRDYLKFAPQASDADAVRSQIETFEKQSALAQKSQ